MWNQSSSFSLQEACSGQIHLALRRLRSNLSNCILPDAVQNFTEICTQCIAQIHLKIETNTFHWNLQHFHFLETLSLSHKLDCFLAFQIFSICFSLLARILQIALAHKWLYIILIWIFPSGSSQKKCFLGMIPKPVDPLPPAVHLGIKMWLLAKKGGFSMPTTMATTFSHKVQEYILSVFQSSLHFQSVSKNQTRIVFSVAGLDWIGGTFCWRLNRDIFTQTYSNTTGRISVGFYIFVGVHLCIVLIFEYL